MRPGIMQVSLEDMTENETPETPATVDGCVEVLSADGGEMEACHTDVMEQSAAISSALDTGEALETVAEKVEETLPEGGMGEKEADALRVAVEALCDLVHFPRQITRKTFPAMEGFNNSASKLETTKLAMEGIAERAKDISGKMMDALKKAVEYAFKFFETMFDKAERLQSTADKIVKLAAGKSKDKLPDGATIKMPPVLAVSGKYIAGVELKAVILKHTSARIITEDRASKLKDVAKLVAASAEDGGTASEALRGLLDWQEQFEKGPQASSSGVVKDGYTAYEHPLAFGGRSFFTYISATGGNSMAAVKETTGSKEIEAADVPAIEPDYVAQFAGHIKDHLKAVYAESKKELGEAKAAVNSLLSDAYPKPKEEAGNGESNLPHLVNSRLHSALNLTLTASASIRNYDLGVCQALLQACAASLKALGKTAPAAEPKEPAAAAA